MPGILLTTENLKKNEFKWNKKIYEKMDIIVEKINNLIIFFSSRNDEMIKLRINEFNKRKKIYKNKQLNKY